MASPESSEGDYCKFLGLLFLNIFSSLSVLKYVNSIVELWTAGQG